VSLSGIENTCTCTLPAFQSGRRVPIEREMVSKKNKGAQCGKLSALCSTYS